MTNKLKVLSLFSGIGSFEKAIAKENLPFELIGFSEVDKYAIESYSAVHNVDKSLNLGSVTEVDGTIHSEIDLLTHGSPCQSFSVVGKGEGGNEGSGTKSSLMWETVRIVSESKPKVVIWENVKGVLNKNHKHNFDRYINELNDIGYTSFYEKINSREYGVAQNRPRVFVVSILDCKEDFIFPEVQELHRTIRDYLDEKVDEKYIVPSQLLSNFFNKDNDFSQRLEVRPIDTYAYCLVAKSGRACRTNNYVYNDLSLYDNNPYGKQEINRMIKDEVKIRALTPLEYWRLQGFTDQDFYAAQQRLNEVFHKGVDKADAQLYKQAGNSITVDVVQQILRKLYNTYYN